MAKVSRLITLDYEINEKLKESDNASGLIEELLTNHFNAHLSNDVNFLTEQAEDIVLKIKTLEVNRDSLMERIRVLRKKAEIHQKEQEAYKEIKNNERACIKFLSGKVRDKLMDFEDYRKIKALDNWVDCVNAVMEGKLDFNELLTQAKHLNTTTTSNNEDGESD